MTNSSFYRFLLNTMPLILNSELGDSWPGNPLVTVKIFMLVVLSTERQRSVGEEVRS